MVAEAEEEAGLKRDLASIQPGFSARFCRLLHFPGMVTWPAALTRLEAIAAGARVPVTLPELLFRFVPIYKDLPAASVIFGDDQQTT